jgi:hypothetical protein
MENPKFSVKEFEAHKVEHEKIAELWVQNEFRKGKNPYSEAAKSASKTLREMESYLKKNGLIPYSEHELLEETLNQKYPKAQTQEIITFKGLEYRKKFTPLELSKTGKSVKKWHSGWEVMGGKL